MRDGDVLLSFNFRADRIRELLAGLLDDQFDGFPRAPRITFAPPPAGMTQYSDDLARRMGALFAPVSLDNILGQVVSAAGRRQLRMAETEKYPHVTYFLNGGLETPYPGEDRIMVPSPKVATYDLQPEMSAPEPHRPRGGRHRLGHLRPDRDELRQPGHGGPHRQPAGRDPRGGRRWMPALGRIAEAIGHGRRRLAGHRRPRQLRDDARPADRRGRIPPTPPTQCRCSSPAARPPRCTTAAWPTWRRACWR